MKKLIPVHAIEVARFLYLLKGGFDGSNFWIFLEEKLKHLFALLVDITVLWIDNRVSLNFFHHYVRI
jgi:hypothetical protein